MSVGIEHLLVQIAGVKAITYSSDTTYGYRIDGREADVDLADRINDMAGSGLLVVNRNVDGSRVTVTGAGWAAIA